MNEEEKSNSHIQMPKCVLKRFENQHHQYYYYDVEKDSIGNHGHATTINTEQGFYSKEAEMLLSANIEKPFSEVCRRIDKIDINPPRGHIDAQFDYFAKRFIYALFARNPDSIDRINRFPFFSAFLSSQQLHDIGMMLGLAAEQERDFLAGYGTTVAVNATEVPFILPTCGAYSIHMLGFEHIIMPVSPKKAIAFIEPNGKDSIIHDGIVNPYRIDIEHDIHALNIGAFSTQRSYGNGYVVSPRRDALEDAFRDTAKYSQS